LRNPKATRPTCLTMRVVAFANLVCFLDIRRALLGIIFKRRPTFVVKRRTINSRPVHAGADSLMVTRQQIAAFEGRE
jgi:hypothetical protein